MTRPKHIAPQKNGRPFSAACDAAEKTCARCGRIFRLRERQQSLAKFQKRKFCSQGCAAPIKLGASGFRECLSETASGCLEWTGRRDAKGYGKLEAGGKNWRAHRYAYTLMNGEIPDGLMVLHSCDNPPCCNPEHLRVGTALDNARDATERNRWNRTGRKMARPTTRPV